MTRLRRAFVTSAIATGGVLIWATPQSGGGLATPDHLGAGCPDARTCPDYVVVGVGWRPNRHHRVVIDYHVNPRSSHSTLTTRSIVAAIRAAAAVWMAADPHLVLVYRGTTTRVAVKDNVFAFGPGGPSAVTQIAHGPGGYFRGHYIHFDVRFSSDVRWVWRRAPASPRAASPAPATPILDQAAPLRWTSRTSPRTSGGTWSGSSMPQRTSQTTS
jgi:hypothetical protein